MSKDLEEGKYQSKVGNNSIEIKSIDFWRQTVWAQKPGFAFC